MTLFLKPLKWTHGHSFKNCTLALIRILKRIKHQVLYVRVDVHMCVTKHNVRFEKGRHFGFNPAGGEFHI